MKRLFIISISALLLASCSEGYRHPMEHELERIDQALEIMDKYVELKENRISTIMEPLADESLPLNQKYAIYGRLYEEYAPYQFDQARKMLELGAHAVVVGGAITRPLEIATRFMNAVKDV